MQPLVEGVATSHHIILCCASPLSVLCSRWCLELMGKWSALLKAYILFDLEYKYLLYITIEIQKIQPLATQDKCQDGNTRQQRFSFLENVC